MEVQGPVLLQRVSRLSNSCEMSNPFCIDLCSDTESVEVSHNLTTENEQVQSDSDEFQPKQCRDKNTNSSGASSSCEEDSDFEINHPKSKIKRSSDRNRQIKVKNRIIRSWYYERASKIRAIRNNRSAFWQRVIEQLQSPQKRRYISFTSSCWNFFGQIQCTSLLQVFHRNWTAF